MCPFKYKTTGLVIIKENGQRTTHSDGRRPIKRNHLTEFAVVSLVNLYQQIKIMD